MVITRRVSASSFVAGTIFDEYALHDLIQAKQIIEKINEKYPEFYTNIKPLTQQIRKIKAVIRKKENA